MAEVSSGVTVEGPPPLSQRRVLVIIGALMLGMFLAALDGTVVSTALPTIVGDLNGASHITWVVTAYLLTSTVSTPIWGKLGDQFGRKVFYQGSIIIFLIGSALTGLSHSMFELITFRALQGLGGGGLMVGAQTSVGDVVSPRDRGRYMGYFMAMFGVTTVIGPLIGGLFVDYLSWRWIFYINIPIGLVTLAITSATLPGTMSRIRRVIDYLGTAMLALSSSCLVLYTSLGGTSYPWGSPFMLGLVGLGVASGIGFVLAERRAKEPVLPLKLFANPVFTATAAIGFVVGFAMFGAMTFLPLFFQAVKGVSPIASGVRLFPLMGGLLIASVGSGQIVSRWGRYKIFPIIGTALMTIGIYLMSLIGVTTGAWATTAYMAIFGFGLGCVMQVLVVAVQNAVPYEELGAATSGNTFFRMIGGCFGTAVFGAIYANLVQTNILSALHLSKVPPGFDLNAENPSAILRLPPAVQAGVIDGIAQTIHTIFLIGVPICFVAFLLTWTLPELELRKSIRTAEPTQNLGLREPRSSVGEIQRILELAARHENRRQLYEGLTTRAGLDLAPRSAWMLYRLSDQPASSLDEIATRLKIDPDQLQVALDDLVASGMVERSGSTKDSEFRLTATGRSAIDKLTVARRDSMTELLEGWDLEAHPEVGEMVRNLARVLLADDNKLLAEARAAS